MFRSLNQTLDDSCFRPLPFLCFVLCKRKRASLQSVIISTAHFSTYAVIYVTYVTISLCACQICTQPWVVDKSQHQCHLCTTGHLHHSAHNFRTEFFPQNANRNHIEHIWNHLNTWQNWHMMALASATKTFPTSRKTASKRSGRRVCRVRMVNPLTILRKLK